MRDSRVKISTEGGRKCSRSSSKYLNRSQGRPPELQLLPVRLLLGQLYTLSFLLCFCWGRIPSGVFYEGRFYVAQAWEPLLRFLFHLISSYRIQLVTLRLKTLASDCNFPSHMDKSF
jgi:hypothetical protein